MHIIKFAFGECFLGQVLVASTDKGICAIAIGDESAQLLADLSANFPKAQLKADESVSAVAEKVVAFINNPQINFSLALDIRGTQFQTQVWQFLQQIPVGQTMSYAEIAKQISSPTAARAVARACATNKLAVVIPCHRVIRGDGSLSGYRWGLTRKSQLLAKEKLLAK
ncbi:methylated-DNA--[protein]-cysteine S-methyltransferase [Catenovulum agarivorans]|uniref:methylated-DNA--[protein]-cysteine S-methyltransferase n=1 Tax=Catenovulum agarivorans TaxID=1172192 RepID=UPI00031FAD47|nr:methylated-DNA--[protein]-cysteine S-methyltransferase [Catenovulum agarivorans]